jgi:glycosyltransferase involved in cell wall biosynthesis
MNTTMQVTVGPERRLKVLVLSRNYPNEVLPLLGLWVEQWTRFLGKHCDCRVVAPVPYCPPVPATWEISRFRRVPPHEVINGIKVSHPRFLSGPGCTLYRFDSRFWLASLVPHCDRLRKEFPFDIIHAHFSYPDGVVAAELARRYGVPFIITEHARWRPWMDRYPSVRKLAMDASRSAAFHTSVSRFVRDQIRDFTGESERLVVTHLGVNGDVFVPPDPGEQRYPNQILYVGRLHLVKGVDVLLNAMTLMLRRRPATRLVLLGGNFYSGTSGEVAHIHQLAADLKLQGNLEFVGPKSPAEVAVYMRRSAVVVLASRSETFGAVLVEALACGTPVVATRCGGPEDVVTEELGRLVPKEDPEALGEALAAVLENPEQFPASVLRQTALDRFSWESVARKTLDLYERAVTAHPPARKH